MRSLFEMTPQSKMRFAFYLIFTLFGLFHAEVLSRSQPWVLLNPLMFFLVAPVYGVHYVVLGDLLLRRKQTGFFPVFIAGCIVGMYEFVITKMFWNPSWTPYAPQVMEVAWMEVFWIGFWWHAFMSFAIPFFLVRKLVLEKHENPLAIKEVQYVLVGVPLISATFGIGFGTPPLELLASILGSLALILGATWYFSRNAPSFGFHGPNDVLLGPVGRRRAALALVAVYAFYGITMRPEAWPSPVGFVIPVLLYAALFLLFYPFVRRRPEPVDAQAAMVAAIAALPPTPPPPPVPFVKLPLVRFMGVYAACFVAYVAWFLVLALVAPWMLFILSLFIILQGGIGAAVLLALAVRASYKMWAGTRPRPARA